MFKLLISKLFGGALKHHTEKYERINNKVTDNSTTQKKGHGERNLNISNSYNVTIINNNYYQNRATKNLESKNYMKTFTKQQFDQIKHQILIIDVRDTWEHQQLKKLPNSINIPFLELVSKPENYIKDKNQLVITYCNYGNRSGQTAQILREKGYKALVLEGGAEGYFSEK